MSFLFIAIFEDIPSAVSPAEAVAAAPSPQASQAATATLSNLPNGAAGETGMVLGTGKERPLSIAYPDGDPEARFESASLHQSNSSTTSSRKTNKPEAETPPPLRAPILKPLSKADQIRLLRPNCAHADDLAKCGGSGRRHCRDCDVVEAAA